VLGLLETHVLPGLAAVRRLVDAVAVGDAALAVVLARADRDHQRVLGVDRDAADREGALALEDGGPGGAGVGGLPHAAGSHGHVPGMGRRGIHGEVPNASAHHGRADVAQSEPGERRGAHGVLLLVVLALLVLAGLALLHLLGSLGGFRLLALRALVGFLGSREDTTRHEQRAQRERYRNPFH
jgi:hypothetical protein